MSGAKKPVAESEKKMSSTTSNIDRALLSVGHVSKSFYRQGAEIKALDDVSFTLAAGECLGIVGRSGCGKSTLARIIAGFLAPDAGSVRFGGRELIGLSRSGWREVYGDLQMIFQQPEESFDPRQTLGWSIAEPLRQHGMSRSAARERVPELLAEAGLPAGYAARYPHEVSGGECQRAAIARAIALRPRLLICDEATSALDVTVQAQIVALLSRLIREHHMASLFITHDLALLRRLATRGIVMHAGHIVEQGSVEQLIDHPHSRYTKELMSADLFTLPREN